MYTLAADTAVNISGTETILSKGSSPTHTHGIRLQNHSCTAGCNCLLAEMLVFDILGCCFTEYAKMQTSFTVNKI